MAQNHIEQSEAPMTRGGTIQGPSRRYRRLRHPTFPADEWTANNPLLQRGELGIESDTHQIKAGDGYTLWNDLPYVSDGSGDEYVLKTGDTMSHALRFESDVDHGAIFGFGRGIELCGIDSGGDIFPIVSATALSFSAQKANLKLGNTTYPWLITYTKTINNGADITVPATGGTMVVATPPSGAGTYVLKAVVDGDGNITTQWVAE